MKINQEKIKEAVRNGAITAITKVMSLCPVQKNKIVFLSYYGKYYNDNPKAISDELRKIGKYDLVWGLDTPHEPEEGVRFVPTNSFRYLYELSTAKVWVDNCRKRVWTRKRKDQYYIQTWHGNLGNKKIEKAAEDKFDAEYIKRAKNDAACTSLMISGSDFFTDLCHTIFWYDGEVLECGTPRLDLFFRFTEEDKKRIFDQLQIPRNAHLVLYAPTFREDLAVERYIFDYQKLLKTLEESTGEKWVLGIRLHPNVTDNGRIPFGENVLDLTSYPDVYQLIAASDRVLSDYSSLTFEAGMIGKPVFLYTPDLDAYEEERGGYWSFEELPFILSKTEEDLIEQMKTFDMDRYRKDLDSFYETLGIHEDGQAAARVARRIMKVIHAEE